MDFSQDYQVKLVSFLCLDKNVKFYLPHVKQEYFETALLQTMAQITLDYWKQYSKPPTATVLRTELQKLPVSFTVDEGAQFETLCQHVEAGTFADIEYIRTSFADFIRNRE